MNNLFCSKCGNIVFGQGAFCSQCGTPVPRSQNPQTFNAATFRRVEKTVPKEMPEYMLGLGIVIACLRKLCGVAGLSGYLTAFAIPCELLAGNPLKPEALYLAAVCLGGSYLLGEIILYLEFFRVRRFLRKKGYESLIRNDGPEITNTLNAFHLCRNLYMVRYLEKLNPRIGTVLSTSAKNSRKTARKQKLRYLPYLAVLAALYCLLPRIIWDDAVCLPLLHLITMAGFLMLGYREAFSAFPVICTGVLFAISLFAYYYEDMWYHIVICAVCAMVGMCLGAFLHKKARRMRKGA